MHLEDSNIQRQLLREVRKIRYHSAQLKLCPLSKGIKGQGYDCVVMVARLTFLSHPWGRELTLCRVYYTWLMRLL